MFVVEAALSFVPYLLSAVALALVFGVTMHAKFKVDGENKPWLAISRATTFFLVFSIFGVVIAYFLSLGLKESGTGWENPLVNQFATPLIALLTAGVSFFAKREAPDGALPIVSAGVTCFLVECVVCYQALLLKFIGGL